MNAILASLLAMSFVAGLAGQVSAATKAETHRYSAPSHITAADDYDFPPFGSEGWWQLQEDR